MYFTRSGQTHALPARLRARERPRRPAAVRQSTRLRHQLLHDARRLRRQQPVLLRRHHRTAVPRRRGRGNAPVGGDARRRSPARASTPRPGTPARCSSSRAAGSRPTRRRSPSPTWTAPASPAPTTRPAPATRGRHRLGAVAVRRRGQLDLDGPGDLAHLRRVRPADRHAHGDRQRRVPRRSTTRRDQPAGSGRQLAAHRVSRTSPCTLLHCDFSSTGSGDSDGDITDYLWDFGDGEHLHRARTRRTTFAPAGGPQHVTLTVTDNDDGHRHGDQGLQRLRRRPAR